VGELAMLSEAGFGKGTTSALPIQSTTTRAFASEAAFACAAFVLLISQGEFTSEHDALSLTVYNFLRL
jgi:hypothetical protein